MLDKGSESADNTQAVLQWQCLRCVQAARGTPQTLGRGYSPGLATSRGRRRSTTPQPVPHEAPPPPPTDSLFCNPAAGDVPTPLLPLPCLQRAPVTADTINA